MASAEVDLDKEYKEWIREKSLEFDIPYIDDLLRWLNTKGLLNEDVWGLINIKHSDPLKRDELYRHFSRFTFARIDDVITCMNGSRNLEVAKQFSDFKEKHLRVVTPITLDFRCDKEPLTGKINVILSKNLGGTLGKRYTMCSKPRGFALIINNEEFSNPSKNRAGSEHDYAIMQELMEKLGYEVTPHKNVTSKTLPTILSDFKDKFKTQVVDSCFVCVMSHGSEHTLLMADMERVNYVTDIIWQFGLKEFNHFKDKPKILVVAACATFSVVGVNPPKPTPANWPVLSNMLVCTATLPGTTSKRSTARGSHFINCFVQVVANEAHDTEAQKLLGTRIQQEMKNVNTSSDSPVLQMPEFKPYLFGKEFYFNPGR